jgi:hypothetical protein
MKSGLIFAVGVFIFNAAVALIACFLHGQAIASILTIGPAIVIYALASWIFFSIGATVFKRSSSVATAFVLGALCALIQIIVGQVATPYIGSVHQMLEFFVLPIVVCSFFAPLASRRDG